METQLKNDCQLTLGVQKNAYLRTTPKYERYYASTIGNSQCRFSVSVFSGPAGSGKSSILAHEYIGKMLEMGENYVSFSFSPDKKVSNHFFLNHIVNQLYQLAVKSPLDKDFSNQLGLLQESIRIQKGQPFKYTEYNSSFIDVLNESRQKIVLFLEDIHLASISLDDFMSQIIKRSEDLNIHVVCTTRSLKKRPSSFRK